MSVTFSEFLDNVGTIAKGRVKALFLYDKEEFGVTVEFPDGSFIHGEGKGVKEAIHKCHDEWLKWNLRRGK